MHAVAEVTLAGLVTATAIPLSLAGVGRGRQVAAAVGTRLPQPVGAVIAFMVACALGLEGAVTAQVGRGVFAR